MSVADVRHYNKDQYALVKDACESQYDLSKPQFVNLPGLSVKTSDFLRFKEKDELAPSAMKLLCCSLAIGKKLSEIEILVIEVDKFDSEDGVLNILARFRCVEYVSVMAKGGTRPQMISLVVKYKTTWSLIMFNTSGSTAASWGKNTFPEKDKFEEFCSILIDQVCSPVSRVSNSSLDFDSVIADQGLIAFHQLSVIMAVNPPTSNWISCKKQALWVFYSMNLLNNFEALKEASASAQLFNRSQVAAVVGGDDSEQGSGTVTDGVRKQGRKRSTIVDDDSNKDSTSHKKRDTTKPDKETSKPFSQEPSAPINKTKDRSRLTVKSSKFPVLGKKLRGHQPDEVEEEHEPQFYGFGRSITTSEADSSKGSDNLYKQLNLGQRANPLIMNNPDHLRHQLLGSQPNQPMIYQQQKPPKKKFQMNSLPKLGGRSSYRKPPSYYDESESGRSRRPRGGRKRTPSSRSKSRSRTPSSSKVKVS